MFSRDHPGRFAITENGNQVGEITAGGTIFLVIFGTVLGIMGAYFYVGLKPWLPGNLAVRGLCFGVLLLRYSDDGSLTLHFAPDLPRTCPEQNWLPTPRGKRFLLSWRSYGADDTTIAGEWFPPPLCRTEA
jgi:hypothetical protein